MLYVVIWLLGGKKVGCFEGWHQVQIVLGSTHIEQRLFSFFPSILTFDFDLILGLLFTFGAPMGYFLAQCVGFKNCFGVHLSS